MRDSIRKYFTRGAVALSSLAMTSGCEVNLFSYSVDTQGCPTSAPAEDGSRSEELCSNTCGYAFDGECDDGGPDSLYSLCEFGSDCADCGPRQPDD